MKISKNLHEQRHTTKFCVKLEKMVTEIKEMLDAAYNESAMSQASIYHWYNDFKVVERVYNYWVNLKHQRQH